MSAHSQPTQGHALLDGRAEQISYKQNLVSDSTLTKVSPVTLSPISHSGGLHVPSDMAPYPIAALYAIPYPNHCGGVKAQVWVSSASPRNLAHQ
eukprot:superscaffoldBa00001080_g8861